MIPHDIPLDLAAVDPGNKVLHVARNQVRRVRNNLCADANVTPFNKCRSLQ